MKKTILLLSLSAFSIAGTAQTSVETLKKDLAKSKSENQTLKDENNFLKEKLNLCTALSSDTVIEIKSFSPIYTIQVASCKGDRNSQTVTIELLITQNSLNKKLSIHTFDSRATDALGNQLKFNDPNSYSYYTVYTDTPLRVKLTVKNVMPGTDMFSLIALRMASDEMDKNPMNFQLTEIKNLKITW